MKTLLQNPSSTVKYTFIQLSSYQILFQSKFQNVIHKLVSTTNHIDKVIVKHHQAQRAHIYSKISSPLQINLDITTQQYKSTAKNQTIQPIIK